MPAKEIKLENFIAFCSLMYSGEENWMEEIADAPKDSKGRMSDLPQHVRKITEQTGSKPVH